MARNGTRGSRDDFDARVGEIEGERYALTLYVLGTTPKALATIKRTREVCERHLAGRYDLRVVDIYQHPGVASADGIVATPTLIRNVPMPVHRLVGTLTDTPRVLRALGLAA